MYAVEFMNLALCLHENRIINYVDLLGVFLMVCVFYDDYFSANLFILYDLLFCVWSQKLEWHKV